MAFSAEGKVHRSTVTGTRGMVASAHPLATLAGVRMLLDGGNAFDAAVATAAALNVVEPYMSGMAGVGYALVYSAGEGRLRTLDYCGRTPHRASLETCPSRDAQEIGPLSCLTPGACGGWLALLERYGNMPRQAVFAPAIELAEKGYAVTVRNAKFMAEAASRLSPTGARVLMSRGHSPRPGDVLIQADLARSFRQVVEGGREVFYEGDLAQEMVRFVQEEGGILSEADLADFETEWLEAISTSYRGYEVFCPPPPSSGFQILETLKMLEAYPLQQMGHQSEVALHLFMEAVKLANADRVEYAALQHLPIQGLLSKAYAEKRRGQIGEMASVNRGEYYASARLPGEVTPGREADWIDECTTHFDAVDAEGNAVAITQSLGSGFGSGMVMGETGMFLNNFIKWADRVPKSPNCIGPYKKVDMCLPDFPGRPARRRPGYTRELGHPADDGAVYDELSGLRDEYPGGHRGAQVPHRVSGTARAYGGSGAGDGARRAGSARARDRSVAGLVCYGGRRTGHCGGPGERGVDGRRRPQARWLCAGDIEVGVKG